MHQADQTVAERDSPEADYIGDGDPLHGLIIGLGRLREEVHALCQVRLDQVRLAIRELVAAAVSRLIGWIAALALGLVAACFVMYGTALGLAALCGDRPWAGFLLAGFALLAALASIVFSMEARDRRRERLRLEEKHGPTTTNA